MTQLELQESSHNTNRLAQTLNHKAYYKYHRTPLHSVFIPQGLHVGRFHRGTDIAVLNTVTCVGLCISVLEVEVCTYKLHGEIKLSCTIMTSLSKSNITCERILLFCTCVNTQVMMNR